MSGLVGHPRRRDEERLGTRGVIVLVAVVAAGFFVRIIALGRLPGINGDEAWYGVNVHLLLDGEVPFLRTGVGNILSPLHSGILLGIESLAGPSFALLRVPSVVWGCVAVAVAYPLFAPLIGAAAALMLTGVLALSPAAVSQARLGWDPSATLLLSLLTVAFVIDNRRWRSVGSFLLALMAHPTNVFLAPIVATQWGPTMLDWYRTSATQVRRRAVAIAFLVAATAGIAGLFAARAAAHAGFLPSIELVMERLTAPSAWYALTLGLTNLFSGATSAAIAGPPPVYLQVAVNVIVVAAFAVAGIGYWRAGREAVGTQMVWLAGGLLVSIISFHVVGGPRALEAGSERYAMFLVTPMAILCVRALAVLGRGGFATGAVLCAALGVMLTFGYFLPLTREGGHGHSTYRTGAVEPKLSAFEFINADSRNVEVVAVFAEDWWLYWPIRYLAWHERRLHVEMLGQYERWLVPPGGARRLYPRPPDRVYAVVFRGSDHWRALQKDAPTLFTAHDPIGRPILDVMLVPSDAYSHLRVETPWQPRN